DTLCDEDHPILLEPPTFPDPVISMAIEPKTKLDQEKMGVALQRLSEEDPTFKVYTHEDTGQTIIAGMGELHLEIIRDRMFREYIPAVKKGIEEAVLDGVLGGYPVVDVEADIVFGSFHEVDSSELAFKMAAIFAMKDGFRQGKPILLEPIMKVENITPEEYQG